MRSPQPPRPGRSSTYDCSAWRGERKRPTSPPPKRPRETAAVDGPVPAAGRAAQHEERGSRGTEQDAPRCLPRTNGDVPDESGVRTTTTGGVKLRTGGTSARDLAAGDDVGATSSGKAFHSAPGRVSARRAGAEPARLAGATSAAETSVATDEEDEPHSPPPALAHRRNVLPRSPDGHTRRVTHRSAVAKPNLSLCGEKALSSIVAR